MRWGAIVVAAGRGTRFGRPKQFVEIAGKPMLAWSIETLGTLAGIEELVVTTEPESLAEAAAIAAAAAPRIPTRAVAGGAQRQDSVRLGLAALSPGIDAVLIHDGARPLVRGDDVARAMGVVKLGTGALLATPVVDTIKHVAADGHVVRTVERHELWAAQTPQLALVADMRAAHEHAAREGVAVTDDAAVLELAGMRVIAVDASPENFKVTVPADRIRAETILRERLAAHGRA